MENEGRRASPEADYDDASAVTNLTVEAVAPRGDSLAEPGQRYESVAGTAPEPE